MTHRYFFKKKMAFAVNGYVTPDYSAVGYIKIYRTRKEMHLLKTYPI